MPTGIYVRTEEHKRKIRQSQPNLKVTDKVLARIVVLYNNGASLYELEQMFSIHYSTIYSHLISSGVIMRSLSNAAKLKCEKGLAQKFLGSSRSGAGEQHWHWKGGISFTYPIEFYKARPYILRRDNFRCQKCGSTVRLDVHHIDEDTCNNDYSNLLTLCRSCHIGIHNTLRVK